MKRYLLFTYVLYESAGGWNDFYGSYDTIEEIKDEFPTFLEDHPSTDRAHIVDTQTEGMVEHWRYADNWTKTE